jgi:hypothetical protein
MMVAWRRTAAGSSGSTCARSEASAQSGLSSTITVKKSEAKVEFDFLTQNTVL